MSGQTSSGNPVLDREDVEKLVKRFQAAVLAENDRCPEPEHAVAMRRAIFDQSELLVMRLMELCPTE